MDYIADSYSSEEENSTFLKFFFILFAVDIISVVICFFLLPDQFLINYGSRASHRLVSWSRWMIFVITPTALLSMLVFRPMLINQFLKTVRKDEKKLRQSIKDFDEYEVAAKMRDTLILTISSVLILFNFGFVFTQAAYKNVFFLNFVILALAFVFFFLGYRYFYQKL